MGAKVEGDHNSCSPRKPNRKAKRGPILHTRNKHPTTPGSPPSAAKVTERLPQFLDAMSDNITGIRHLMMRDPKTGKFERITGDAKQIDKALKSKNACWIYTKDPNIAAFTDLLNRAIDKPAEHIQVAGEGSITIRWQTDDGEKESGEVLELSEGERLRHARRGMGMWTTENRANGKSARTQATDLELRWKMNEP
jgi:hypothetical protein